MKMVVTTGLEPVTTSMSRKHSTTELRDHTFALWSGIIYDQTLK